MVGYVRRGMTSPPLYSTHGRTTSGVAYHHHLWAAHTIKRRRAGHAIIAHGRQTRLNDVRRDMPSPSLDSTHGRTTLGVACHLAFGKHTRSKYVGRGMTSPPLYITHSRTTSGVAYHHHLWAAQTIKRRRAGHAILAHGRQTQLNDVRRDMPSPSLDNKHGR